MSSSATKENIYICDSNSLQSVTTTRFGKLIPFLSFPFQTRASTKELTLIITYVIIEFHHHVTYSMSYIRLDCDTETAGKREHSNCSYCDQIRIEHYQQ